MQQELTVKVPGTSANLGPGFDCLGIALQIYNWFYFKWEKFTETVSPQEQYNRLAVTFPDELPMLEAYVKYCEIFDLDLPLLSEIKSARNDVPVARGLGSSATCYVAGARAAQWVAEQLYSKAAIIQEIKTHSLDPFSKEAIFVISTMLEKHPDNVCPAIFGGLQVSLAEFPDALQQSVLPKMIHQAWQVHPDLCFLITYPNFVLKTADSRKVLPEKISRADCIFNLRALSFLLKGMELADADLLRQGLQDKIHQPYREKLIPGFAEIEQIAKEAGAFGSVISGAGSAILSVCHKNSASTILAALKKRSNHTWKILALSVDEKGYTDHVGYKID